MDLLDIRLLRALGLRPFQGPARAPADLRPRVLARQVGLSRETVRQRLSALRQDGVLLGFDLVPNFHLLGLATTTYHVVIGEGQQKADALASWRRSGRVSAVFDFVGRDLCIEVTHLRGEHEPMGGAVMDVDRHPEPRGLPSPLAWRLLRVLRHDALKPLDDVAAEVGCSARTARRLARDVAERGHADVIAVVDPSAMEGLVASLFAVRADADAAGVLATFGDHRVSSWQSPNGVLWVAAFAASPLGLSELADRVRACPGVVRVEQLIPGRVDSDPSSIDERLANAAT